MTIFFRVTVQEKSSGDIIANRSALCEQEADDWKDYYDMLFDTKGHTIIKQDYDTRLKRLQLCRI